MKDEKNLVQKLTLLKSIEPKDNWVLFAKNRILEDGAKMPQVVGHFVSYLRYLEKATFALRATVAKPAYVFAALAFVVLGGVGYKISQNSLPGDALYSVRSVIEKATIGSDPLASLEVAQRRLQDLRKVVEGNKVKNLPQATKDFNLSVTEVSKGLLALVENEPDKALQLSRELVQLQKDKAQIEQILGAAIGEEEALELTNATKVFVESELTYLLNHTLTEEQNALLRKALFDYQAEDYEAALEKIWAISN
ncbi:hypothetical protein IH982_03470 [Patescibacteria group bacterium]|nr:hypothetical protein [Patescibacteria group bacterium]